MYFGVCRPPRTSPLWILRDAYTSLSLSLPSGVLYSFFRPGANHSPPSTLWGALKSASLTFKIPWFVSSVSDFSPLHTLFPGTPVLISLVTLSVAGGPESTAVPCYFLCHICGSSRGAGGSGGLGLFLSTGELSLWSGSWSWVVLH